MALGIRGGGLGLLPGQENQGIQIMFHMMNEARFNFGFQAFTYGSSAYLYAANYARALAPTKTGSITRVSCTPPGFSSTGCCP
ncbi:MAG: hypothetical protein V1793_05860 [Pseudomonadota bacterium]